MKVEISGVNFRNMGAELMMAAARLELMSWGEVDGLAINFLVGTPRQRRKAGCVGVASLESGRLAWARPVVTLGAAVTPSAVLRLAGMTKPSTIDALVDASGFTFGDQLGVLPSLKKARLFGTYAQAHKPVVLLPQAFGPFEDLNVARAAASALEQADLVFARDPDSHSHLQGLGLLKPSVKLAPDFTNLVEPPPQPLEPRTVIVIPNGRMTRMVSEVTESSYLGFLRSCTATALELDFRVMVLADEPMDRRVAAILGAEFGSRIAQPSIDDPIRTKALVGGAALVISSRFHGLVSALSQGVPAIGTSWSHKYPQLFADYGCQDALWDVTDPATTSERLATWLTEPSLAARREALKAPAEALKKQTRAMWSCVRATLCP